VLVHSREQVGNRTHNCSCGGHVLSLPRFSIGLSGGDSGFADAAVNIAATKRYSKTLLILMNSRHFQLFKSYKSVIGIILTYRAYTFHKSVLRSTILLHERGGFILFSFNLTCYIEEIFLHESPYIANTSKRHGGAGIGLITHFVDSSKIFTSWTSLYDVPRRWIWTG